MMRVNKYKAGTVLLLESGEYSDFGYCGHLVTLKDIDIEELINKHKAEYKPKDKWDEPCPESFVGWLVMKQYCAPLEHQSLHIGSYNRLEL